MQTYEALDRAIASTATVVKGVAPEQLGWATPCTEWDVRALLNHIVGSLWLLEGLLSDSPAPDGAPPGGLPDHDVVGTDVSAAYAEAGAAALAAAATEGAFSAAHQTPLGAMPGAVLAGFLTLDVVVHGWDLAQATGQDVEIEPDLAAHVLAFARQMITDGTRGQYMAPAVAVAQDASTLDRLVAHTGRQP